MNGLTAVRGHGARLPRCTSVRGDEISAVAPPLKPRVPDFLAPKPGPFRTGACSFSMGSCETKQSINKSAPGSRTLGKNPKAPNSAMTRRARTCTPPASWLWRSSSSQAAPPRQTTCTCTLMMSSACSQCFAKCPFTCQFDRLSEQFCQSLDRRSDHFAKHCV